MGFFKNEAFIVLATSIIVIRMISIGILVLSSFLIRILCASSASLHQKYYPWLVTLTYYYGFHYHLHLYLACFAFAVQLVIQVCLLGVGFLIRLFFDRSNPTEGNSESYSQPSSYVPPQMPLKTNNELNGNN